MKNYSIWTNDLKKKFNKLNKNLTTDVLIIGGGITGVNVAYQLSKTDLNITLVEKNIIGSGVTSRTTGKLTYLQENYNKIKTYHNEQSSKLYLDSQMDAIKLAKNIIEQDNIDCDLEQVKSFIINNKDKNFYKEKELLEKFNIKLNITNTLPNKNIVKDSYYVNDTYVFNPIKYINSLTDIIKDKVNIYENTLVTEIVKEKDYYICKANTNIIKTKYIVFALHYPYFLIPFLTPLKTKLEKSYIGAYKVNNNYKFSSITTNKPVVSTRFYKDYQLLLINSHNISIKNNNKLEFKEILNNNPEYVWSNKDIITNDYIPFIGSLNNDNTMLIATGYNTWGMTNSILAGKIIADIILKKDNKYINLFNPKRSINIGKIINTPIILTSNIYSFTKSKINKQKSWYKSNIRFEKRNGKNIAIYIDENNKEHIVYNLCPHLKCSLIFNEIEHTWDCPCHGSRFDIDGECLEGPSNYNITYKD